MPRHPHPPTELPVDSWAAVVLQSWVIHPDWTAHQHLEYLRTECWGLPWYPSVWRVQSQLEHYQATRDQRTGALL